MVKNIEELRAKLKIEMFGQRRILLQRSIEVGEPRPVQRIPLQIAVRPRRGEYEGVRIEILLRSPQDDVAFESSD